MRHHPAGEISTGTVAGTGTQHDDCHLSILGEGGMAIRSELNEGPCRPPRQVTDEYMDAPSIGSDAFHGEWSCGVSLGHP